MRGRVDGLVLMSPEFTGDLSKRALPEWISRSSCSTAPPSDLPHDSLTVANYEGAQAMVRHLAGLGHRRIAIIQGAEGNFDAAERLRGYRAALEEAGLPASPRARGRPATSAKPPGDAGARALARLPHRPTAIFAANDGMAIGALHALRDAGLRVPEDIAIGGFDDIPMARYVEPALTSVHVDISALGERAAARLFSALDRR